MRENKQNGQTWEALYTPPPPKQTQGPACVGSAVWTLDQLSLKSSFGFSPAKAESSYISETSELALYLNFTPKNMIIVRADKKLLQ